jgi:hypothetical protein
MRNKAAPSIFKAEIPLQLELGARSAVNCGTVAALQRLYSLSQIMPTVWMDGAQESGMVILRIMYTYSVITANIIIMINDFYLCPLISCCETINPFTQATSRHGR